MRQEPVVGANWRRTHRGAHRMSRGGHRRHRRSGPRLVVYGDARIQSAAMELPARATRPVRRPSEQEWPAAPSIAARVGRSASGRGHRTVPEGW